MSVYRTIGPLVSDKVNQLLSLHAVNLITEGKLFEDKLIKCDNFQIFF